MYQYHPMKWKDPGLPLNFPTIEVAAMLFVGRAPEGLLGTPFKELFDGTLRWHTRR